MKIAVIGCGWHSRRHAEALRELHDEGLDFELDAVCDLDASRADDYRARYGFARGYTDFHAMMRAETPDVVLVETPPALNAAVAMELLAYRVPLLVEKPPGRDDAEVRALTAAAEAAGVSVMVSFDRRFNPALVAAKRWLDEHGKEVAVLEAVMVRHRRIEPEFVRETGIHLADTIHFLAGPTTKCQPLATDGDMGCRGTIGLLRSASGAFTRYSILPASGIVSETYTLHGEDFTVFVDRCAAAVRIVEAGKTVADVPGDPAAESVLTHRNEMQALLGAIRGERPFAPSLHDGLRAVRLTRAMAGDADVYPEA